MKEFIEKLIERLNKALPMYASGWRKDMNEIVNQLAEEYKPCRKPCTGCEEYDLVRHHCPKFCKVIKETVKEIEENNSDWIPCSERLPSDFGAVFITAIALNGTSCTEIGKWNGNQWFHGATNTRIDIAEVIAWQPLPAPYQPKGE